MNLFTVPLNRSYNYSYDSWAFDYDKNGHTKQKGTQKFFYDYRNQMVRLLDPDGEVNFKYDVLGRRIKKEAGSQTTRYYYDGNQVIEERDGADVLQKQYVYGSGIDDILRMDKYNGVTSTSYYFHKNAIGSPTAITDGNGNLVERMKYDLLGQATIFDHFADPSNPVEVDRSVIGNEYLFHARRYDRETNLYYYRARYYDPTIGRFLQTDPMGYQDSMNLYQAFNMNGDNFVDPMGEELDIAYFSAIRDNDRIKTSNDIAKVADWGNFFSATGHDIWNAISLGTLSRVENQDNLGTWSGIGGSIFNAGRSVTNTLTLGFQDSIYKVQMQEGAGLKSIWKGTKQAVIDLTPLEEIKTIFDPNANTGEKWSAFFMSVSKTAGYIAGYKGLKTKKINRGQYLRKKYKHLSREQRLARIDELAGKNYKRILNETIKRKEYVYRYLSEEGLNKSLISGEIRGYMTDNFSFSSAEVANGAQIFPRWGTPKYGVAIPTNKLRLNLKVPRPFGNKAAFGWELFTNSYPSAGSGKWMQFLGSASLEDGYIFSLTR